MDKFFSIDEKGNVIPEYLTVQKANRIGLKNLYNSAVVYFKTMLGLATSNADPEKKDGGYSDWVDNSQTATNKFIVSYQGLQEAIANQSVQATLRNTALRETKRALSPEGKKFLRNNVLDRVTSIDDTLKERMKAIFLEASKNNTNLLGLKQALKDEFGQLIKDGKIDTIANTEFNTAYHYGQNEALSDWNDELNKDGEKVVKVWETSGGPNVRESHQQLDGEEVDFDEPFSNGLMYPSDPNGDPSEIINCQCTLVPKRVKE